MYDKIILFQQKIIIYDNNLRRNNNMPQAR